MLQLTIPGKVQNIRIRFQRTSYVKAAKSVNALNIVHLSQGHFSSS